MKNEKGLIKIIIVIIIFIAILSYFNISVRAIVESDIFQENFSYIWNWCKNIWNTYLVGIVSYLWNIFIDLIWEPSIDALKNIKSGESQR